MGKVNMNLEAILSRVENRELSINDSLQIIDGLFNKPETDKQGVSQPAVESSLCYFHSSLQRSELPNSSKPAPAAGYYLIFDMNPAIMEDLHAYIRSTGSAAATVVWVKPGTHFHRSDEGHYEIDPLKAADYITLLEGITAEQQVSGASSGRLHIVLHPLQLEKAGPDQPLLHEAEFYSLFYIVKALLHLKISHSASILLLAQVSDSAVINGLQAAAGFARALQQEDPRMVCKTVTYRMAANTFSEAAKGGISRLLLNELQLPAARDIEVVYTNGVRYLPVAEPLKIATPEMSTLPVSENGLYLITGGLGGIGYSIACYLAERAKVRLLLIGRSELNATMNRKLERLRDQGSAVFYAQADVSNELELQTAIRSALSGQESTDVYGIKGVIHCAGVIKDSYLWYKTEKEAAEVLAPKVQGTLNLDTITQLEPLDFFLLFSSIVASLGNAGQTDYAYANGFMDGFAGNRHSWVQAGQRKGRTLSINWPVWLEGGMKAPQDDFSRFTSAGLRPLPTDLGIEALEHAYASGSSKVIVGYGEPQRIYKSLQPVNDNDTPESHFLVQEDQEESGQAAALQTHTEELLAEIFAGLLKIPASSISPEAPFSKLGVDSFIVNRFNYLMKNRFGKMSATLLYEYNSLKSLAAYLIKRYPERLTDEITGQAEENKPAREAEQASPRKVQQPLPVQAPLVEKVEKVEKVQVNTQDIAIIGVSGRYPQAENLEQLWQNLSAGKDCITEIPKERWSWQDYYDDDPGKAKEGKIYGKWGGFIDGFDQFDPLLFHISPREAKAMDPQERLFLEVSREVMEDAGYGNKLRSELSDSGMEKSIGVFVGATSHTYSLWAPESWQKNSAVLPQSMPWSIANRVSYTFNFSGPSMPVDTACSSSLTAIHLASDSIRRGECSMAIAGGINLYLHPLKYLYLCQMKMLSTSGRCRSFGDEGDGFVPGEGAGAVLLKPLQAAIKDGDHIYAVIKSSAVNHGGHTSGYTVPNPNAQAALIQDAMGRAGVHPRTLGYIETHGTGTSLGDPIEISGLQKAFEGHTSDKQFCSIGSVKSNVGHLEAAAGILSLTKVILQLKHKMLVPSLHADPPNPNIDFADTPFYVQRELAEWKPSLISANGVTETHPRRAGISSFGAGGVNAHLIVEEYNPQQNAVLHRVKPNEPQLFVLSAVNEERLKVYAARVAEHVHMLLSSKGDEGNRTSHQAVLKQAVEQDFIAFVAAAAEIHADEVNLDGDMQEYNIDLYTFTEIVGKLMQKHNLTQGIPDLPLTGSLRECLQAFSFASTEFMSVSPAITLLSDMAYSLQTGREEMSERLAFKASSYEELYRKLSAFSKEEPNLEHMYTGNSLQDHSQLMNLMEGPEGGQYINELIDHKQLGKLARLWSWGFRIQWERLYKEAPPHRVPLPAYPFARDRYWFDRVTDSKESNANQRSMGRLEEMRSYSARDEVELSVSEDGFAVVTLQDRENRNMYSEGINEGLISAFAQINGNEQIKAVIVTGADKVFCMGGTAENLNNISNLESKCTDLSFVYQGFLQCKVPVIAAMQGHAVGGGLVLGLFADIVIMATEGVYSANFTQYGFTPGVGATYILREKLGNALAMEMMFTARSFTGGELQKRGASLIFRDSDDVLNEAIAVAKMLVKKPYQTLTVLKQELAGRILAQLPAVLESEVTMHDTVFAKIDVSGLIKHYTRTDSERPLVQANNKLKLKTTASAVQAEDTRPAVPQSVNLGLSNLQTVTLRGFKPHPVSLEMDEARLTSSLKELVGAILHIPAKDVGVELGFHELGFDSISGVELVRDINRLLPINVDSIVIYDYPNIRELAKYLSEEALPNPSLLNTQVAGGLQKNQLPVEPLAEAGPISFASQQIDRKRGRPDKLKLSRADQTAPIAAPLNRKEATPIPAVAEIKQIIAELVANVLHLSLPNVSTQSALRELGVDSITTVEMVRDLNKTFQIELDAVTIYDYPTIDLLAVYIYEEISMKTVVLIGPEQVTERQKTMNWLTELEAGQLNIDEVEKLLEDIS
ncbi:SDR family NAD(P)-dependent oxidoreductase [Paenibacillus monticola]|uniref:KR domain-containing protein n=1 Tax=Paenibacillus monticola TaxID=2666075 RepID=A0A7X2KZM4_9BACL|nr:SDR family NAD(P)-dependent oxidoreductase [Paenibacillus monticola]MRN51862.1 KR domain-containing protein [Paenibacillus monticola]